MRPFLKGAPGAVLNWLSGTGAGGVSGNLTTYYNAPVSGVPEMVTLSIVVIVFLQAPQSLKAGRMTRSDAVLNVLKARAPGVARSLETLYDLAAIAVVGAGIFGPDCATQSQKA